MATVKIKSTHPESQGPFVIVEESDYDPVLGHKLYEEAPPKRRPAIERAEGEGMPVAAPVPAPARRR